jgi:hypothetical protein
MPKLIVLVSGDETTAATLADSAVEGAKSVRFTEVDVRMVVSDTAQSRHKMLESPDVLREYDGIVITADGISAATIGAVTISAVGDSSVNAELSSVLDALEAVPAANAFANTVFTVVGGSASLLARIAALGGIIVAEPRGIGDGPARARAQGARTAKVIEWVRHALSHEQKDHAHHDHH